MRIETVTISNASKNGFSSTTFHDICHKKVLPYLSVVQAVEGSYDIQLDNGATYNTGSGGFFVAPANAFQCIVHKADPATGHLTCRWAFLRIKLNDVYYFDEKFAFPTVLPHEIKGEMNAVFDALFATEDAFQESVCYHKIAQLLSRVATEKAQPLPAYMEQALQYLKDNYREKLTVEDIARKAHLSASRLHAVFKREMGVSPICFLNNYRLSVAAQLLQATTKSVQQIAAEVGIPDGIYFNKLFKKHYQMSPSQYRSDYKNQMELEEKR